jgi:dCTP deaminase
MILSNIAIQKAIDQRRLVIAPEPFPRIPNGLDGEDCPYQTSSVDLRLAPEISYFKEGLPLDINLSRGGFAQLFGPMSESFKISEGQPFVLRP